MQEVYARTLWDDGIIQRVLGKVCMYVDTGAPSRALCLTVGHAALNGDPSSTNGAAVTLYSVQSGSAGLQDNPVRNFKTSLAWPGLAAFQSSPLQIGIQHTALCCQHIHASHLPVWRADLALIEAAGLQATPIWCITSAKANANPTVCSLSAPRTDVCTDSFRRNS